MGINRRDLVFDFTPITVFDRPEAASVPCHFQALPPGCTPLIMQYHPFPKACSPTLYFPPLKSDTRHCHSHGPSLLPVRPIFNFLRPLYPTPFMCGWMWVRSSGSFIRLCDRIEHGHQCNMFSVAYGCAIGSNMVTSATCLAFHTAVRSDPTWSPAHV